MDCAEALRRFWLSLFALLVHVCASGRTAPPDFPARVATDSLDSDHRNSRFVRLLLTDLRRGSPPTWAFSSSAAGTSASRALSPLCHLYPASAESFHPVLP